MSKAAPARHQAPLPPADLARRSPMWRRLQKGATLHRFFRKVHDPLHFDRSQGGRFNSPDGDYGVMYLSVRRDGAFAETFLRTPGATLISLEDIEARAYVRYRLRRQANLVLLSGAGLARLGATAEVCHRGLPYDVPQAWSRALHGTFKTADGIAYMSRHDDRAPCVALFQRADDLLVETGREDDLDQDWFVELALKYGIGIALPHP